MVAKVSRLLVLGPNRDSNEAVTTSLRKLCGNIDASAKDPDATSLSLETKYYQAHVQLHVHEVRDNAPEPALQHELDDYEAILCVVNAEKYENFLHVQSFAKQIVDILPYDVCLLVSHTSSATLESVKKMESWCQENGFELISLDATSDDRSVIDEKRGVSRVLEALQCTMWRSMKRNFPSKTERGAILCEKEESNRNNVVTKTLANTKLVDDDAFVDTLEQEMSGDGVLKGGEGDDIDLDQLSAFISEVRTVRDHGAFLSDEKRRERAAEVALKLWNVLGTDDNGGDSDD
ncbi:hypothetical protein CCR75_001633 [Bremia lactucae]|uniref:Alpha-and gamma-adaptin-binding protein p34 n=1 Tax=Bremia lactucae TaxID=4779 RepID=A0A976FPN0_BRELC|nr:hypothetical protein CCR75_001633 [Bremia lactucae]